MRRERIDLRVLPAEKVRWSEAAQLLGLSSSEMIRQAMNPWVESVLAETGANANLTVDLAQEGSWVMVDGRVQRLG